VVQHSPFLSSYGCGEKSVFKRGVLRKETRGMTQDEQRQLALGAVRSYLRGMRIDPMTVTAADAFVCLDELFHIEPDTLVSQWYWVSSDQQHRLFCREWRQWQVQQQQQQRVSARCGHTRDGGGR
jgi:hypothetical protein